MDPAFCCPVRGAVHVCEWGARGDASLVTWLARGNARADGHDADDADDDWPLHVDSDVKLGDASVPFGEFSIGTHPRHLALVSLPSPSGPVSTPLADLLKSCPYLAGSRVRAAALPPLPPDPCSPARMPAQN